LAALALFGVVNFEALAALKTEAVFEGEIVLWTSKLFEFWTY
jgi:hypothetical protein